MFQYKALISGKDFTNVSGNSVGHYLGNTAGYLGHSVGVSYNSLNDEVNVPWPS